MGLDPLGNTVFARINCDVAEGTDTPVLLVDAGGVLVDLDGVGAPSTHPGQGGVEAADPCEEVGVGERLGHESS